MFVYYTKYENYCTRLSPAGATPTGHPSHFLCKQGSRKFRQNLGRAVQAQSKIDPDTDALRDIVEEAMAEMPDEALDEPVGNPPEDALGVQAVED